MHITGKIFYSCIYAHVCVYMCMQARVWECVNACGIVRACVQFWVCRNRSMLERVPVRVCLSVSVFECECVRVSVRVSVSVCDCVCEYKCVRVRSRVSAFECQSVWLWVGLNVCLRVCSCVCTDKHVRVWVHKRGFACMLYEVLGILFLAGNTIVEKIWLRRCSSWKILKFKVRQNVDNL